MFSFPSNLSGAEQRYMEWCKKKQKKNNECDNLRMKWKAATWKKNKKTEEKITAFSEI